jgi:hypothetical protein
MKALHRVNKVVMKIPYNDPSFTTDIWILDPDLSAVEGIDPKYWKIVGDIVSEMSQSEKDAVDAEELYIAKQQAMKQVDNNTRLLIDQGFDFAGYTFPLSAEDQSNFMALKVAYDSGMVGEEGFPYMISTIDNVTYMLSYSDASIFFDLCLYHGSYHLQVGRSLKSSIMALTSLDSVVHFSDPRIS